MKYMNSIFCIIDGLGGDEEDNEIDDDLDQDHHYLGKMINDGFCMFLL